MESIAHTPKSLRALHDRLSQDALAKKAGVSTGTVQSIERGEDVNVYVVREVAKALGIAPATLLAAMDIERASRDAKVAKRADLASHARAGLARKRARRSA